MKKKDWSNHILSALLPFLCVFVIYAADGFTRISFFGCDGNAGCESIPIHLWKVFNADLSITDTASLKETVTDAERKAVALRYSGRINWFFLSEIFSLASLGSLGLAFVLTYQVSPQPRGIWALGVLLLAVLVGLFFYANPNIHMAMFMTLFEKAITPDLKKIEPIMKLLNSLGNAALFALLMTICITLIPVQSELSPVGLKDLARRIKQLNVILSMGTFLLVTGILVKYAVYQWTLAYTVQADASLNVAGDFISTLLTWEGGFYTLVLAAANLPAIFVLRRRAQLLLDSSLSEAERAVKMKEIGMDFAFKETAFRVLAILGPLLTGPIGQLLTGKFF